MKKHLEEISPAALEPSPWNPRAAADLDHENAEMQKLISSVRASGIHQSLAVWKRGEYDLVVIAGHRRHAAALAAGLETVPCIVYEGIDETEARSITRIENEIRLGVSPLEDAKLLSSMFAAGWKQNELAARFGASCATICRRMKLINLSPKMRETLEAATAEIDTYALEQIAAYPHEIQDTALKSIKGYLRGPGKVGWSELAQSFYRQTRDLDDENINFNAAEICAACPNRSGAQGDLFGEAEEGKLGVCYNCECFQQKCDEAAFENMQSAAHAAGAADIVNGEMFVEWWKANSDDTNFSDKKSKRFSSLWYWKHIFESRYRTRWGLSEAQYIKAKKREEEKKQLEAKRNERFNELDAAVDKARDAITGAYQDCEDEVFEAAALRHIFSVASEGRLLAKAFRLGFDDYDFDMDDIFAICEAYPEFAAEIGITDEMINAYRIAVQALAGFRAKENGN